MIDQCCQLRRLERRWFACFPPFPDCGSRLSRCNILHRSPCGDTGQRAFDQLVTRPGKLVVDFAQQPVFALFLRAALDTDQHPFASHSLAMECEVEMSFIQILRAFSCNRCPGSIVPQHNSATAIFGLGNRAFKRAVTQRMIFCTHGKPLVGRIEARSARDCPAFQHAVHLDPEIPVQPRSIVLLHDKRITVRS